MSGTAAGLPSPTIAVWVSHARSPPQYRSEPMRVYPRLISVSVDVMGWKRGRRGCSRQRYAAAPTSVTHVLRPGRGILMRPPRLRPKSSRLDCSRSRFDDGLCERVLPLDARKQPPVSEPRLPMFRCVGVGSSPLDGATPANEASRANPEFLSNPRDHRQPEIPSSPARVAGNSAARSGPSGPIQMRLHTSEGHETVTEIDREGV